MQYVISTLLLVGVALAAPEAPPSNGGPYPASENNGGPYPPSGWKPSGRLLLLPARQVAQTYGAPASDYGTPQAPTEAEPTTTEYPNSTAQEDEPTNPSGFAFQQQQQQPGAEHGVYHVLLPDGRLQRVEYSTAPLNAAQQVSSGSSQQAQDNSNNFQQEQNSYQQQSQSGNYQQGQFEQQNYPQVTQVSFPSSFPQPLYIQPQNNRYQVAPSSQNSNLQQPQSNNYQANQASQSGNYQPSRYQTSQNGKQSAQSTSGNRYAPSQSSRFTQSKSQAQSQYPQQPEYEQGASQNQFNRQQFKQQQAANQNKQSSSNTFTSETSSRFTNSNAQQVQAEVVEYQPIYYAQQTAAQEAPAFTGFVANVQYKDVEPIATPIYSYNPSPLVRVLRKIE